MKIYVAHAGTFDYEKKLYEPLRSSPLAVQHEFIFPHEEKNERFDSKEVSRTCDLFVAEVSEPSTGEGIEIGRAEMMNVPILFIYESGHKISRSLKFVSDKFIEYKNSQDLIEKLTDFIDDLA
jgi:hypothetical protein